MPDGHRERALLRRPGVDHLAAPIAMTGVPSGLLNSTPWCCWKLPPIVEP